MKDLICAHLKHYPKMQLSDIVKLICQSEFGGNHPASASLFSLSGIEQEYLSAPLSEDFFEHIGNGLCRLYIGNAKQSGISANTVLRLFTATSKNVHGSTLSYKDKLEQLCECIKHGPFDLRSLQNYILNLDKNIETPVRHSQEYRDAYRPSYRIVKNDYCKYIKAFDAIESLLAKKKSIVVAIDGRSGAGKSTLAALFCQVYDNCTLFHMDDFFVPLGRKTKERLAVPGENIDHERFKKEVLSGLENNLPINYKQYDCAADKYVCEIKAHRSELNIIEGVYSMHPALRYIYDYSIFLDVDAKTQEWRIKKRSGDEKYKRFVKEWIPLEELYFSCHGIKKLCNISYAQ